MKQRGDVMQRILDGLDRVTNEDSKVVRISLDVFVISQEGEEQSEHRRGSSWRGWTGCACTSLRTTLRSGSIVC